MFVLWLLHYFFFPFSCVRVVCFARLLKSLVTWPFFFTTFNPFSANPIFGIFFFFFFFFRKFYSYFSSYAREINFESFFYPID